MPEPDSGDDVLVRREAARAEAVKKRAGTEGLLALSMEEAKEARGIAYKAEADRRVQIKATKRRLALAMKDPRLDLGAAMKAAEELSMYADGHYKLAAERLMGRAAAAAGSLTLERWMFINTPATDRRVLRFFRLRWNADAVCFFLERDETGEHAIPIYRHDAVGKCVFAQCYLLPLGEKGTTAGSGDSTGGWDATEGPESQGIESGREGGENWEEGVLRIIDANDKVWDLTSVRANSRAWAARVKELESSSAHFDSTLATWKEWIEASIDSFKDEEIEVERQRQIALGCHAGPPVARLMAYRGPNPENWNKSSLDVLRDDIVADKSLTRLLLEQNTLTCFPTNMLNMTSLTELWLGHNRLESADEQVMKKFARRAPLTFLSLDCNYLDEIPASIGDLSLLQELRLSANGLQIIPPLSISRLGFLTTLWLQNNRLSLLPDDMGLHLNCLQTLFINNNDLTCLPKSVAGWTTLELLHVHENRIESLPADMHKTCSLRVLKASTNKISVLPERMEELSALRRLELGHNHIQRLNLPDGGMLRLSNMEALHLESNLLLELPGDETDMDAPNTQGPGPDEEGAAAGREGGDGGGRGKARFVRSGSYECTGARPSEGIVGLSSLTDLRVDCNKLLVVPPDIGRMTQLQKLALAHNRIQWLPVEMGELAELHTITLHGNPVLSLRPELMTMGNDAQALISYFHMEKEQDHRNCRLTSVPGHISSKLMLQGLYLSHNEIRVLPPTLHVLHELRTLHVDNNSLFIIEPWIGSLESLTDVALDKNRLLSLPSTFGLLTQLRMLTLEYNSISSLPVSHPFESRLWPRASETERTSAFVAPGTGSVRVR